MTRKRYIWDDEVNDLVEITPGYEPSRKGKDAANHLGSLWGDRHYDGLRATDGADISTRKKHLGQGAKGARALHAARRICPPAGR